MLQLTFNPRLTLTGFRTTRARTIAVHVRYNYFVLFFAVLCTVTTGMTHDKFRVFLENANDSG